MPMMPTRLVSLTIPTKSLPAEGTATRTACGRMIDTNARGRLMPSESAASRWPDGTAVSPVRKTSDMNAVWNTVSEITPALKLVNLSGSMPRKAAVRSTPR